MTEDPYAVFTWLPRAQRAEYVRKMRDMWVVRERDLRRAWRKLRRAVGYYW